MPSRKVFGCLIRGMIVVMLLLIVVVIIGAWGR
jgi:hypothetical protein